ncbi:MAG: lactate racemase domain-containing protein [Christensenellales bacterium]|jgi:nickel-dependent lactate racemase
MLTKKIAYYDSSIEVKIPKANLIGELVPVEMPVLDDVAGHLEYQLEHPVGTLKFSQLIMQKEKFCIIVCDLTRPMETHKILPVIIERIEEICPNAQITMLVALGTHRPLSESEIDIVCGRGVRGKYPVINHDYKNKDVLVNVGSEENPIYVHRLLRESDFVIGIGAVKPHPIFGWSGGAKLIIPGVAGAKEIGESHWMSCPYKGVEIEGKVENPIRRHYEKIVKDNKLLDFIVNAVLTEESRISDLRCGDVIKAHRECVNIAKKYYTIDVSEPADAVVVGVGKWGPDLWVGSNAVYQSEFYLRKGGSIVLLGCFPEGVSNTHPDISKWGYKPYTEVKKMVEAGVISDIILAAHLVHLGRVLEARDATCYLLSRGISPEETEKLGFISLSTTEEIIPTLTKKYGENFRVLVIPGFNSTPIISSTPQL